MTTSAEYEVSCNAQGQWTLTFDGESERYDSEAEVCGRISKLTSRWYFWRRGVNLVRRDDHYVVVLEDPVARFVIPFLFVGPIFFLFAGIIFPASTTYGPVAEEFADIVFLLLIAGALALVGRVRKRRSTATRP